MSALASVPRETFEAGQRLELLALASIDVGENVRVDPGSLVELVASIAELGVLEPVRAVGPNEAGRYRLVWGQRRFLACSELGLLFIPAVVVDTDEADKPGAQRSIEQLAENLIRKDLNPIEEAVAMREVLDADPALTQDALAKRLGMSAPWVSNTLRLLEADEVVKDGVRRGTVTASHAKSLVTLPVALQRSLVERIEKGLSAHQLEGELRWRLEEVKRKEATAERTGKAIPKAIAALAAIPKTTVVYLQSIYNLDSGPIAAAIKKAGWKVTNEYVRERGGDSKCDCTAVRLEFSRTWKVVEGCVDDKHRDRQRNVDHAADRAREQRIREQIQELTALVDAHLEALPIPPPLLRLMAARNYHDLPELFAAGDDVLHETRALLAQRIAGVASSQYAYGDKDRRRADATLTAVIDALRPAGSASPEASKRKRGAFTPAHAAAAVAELEAEGLT